MDVASRKTIAASAQACLDNFGQCMACSGVLLPREVALIEDQVGRFSIWAANIGALATHKASTDYRLSEAPEIHQLVVGLLGNLDDSVSDCVTEIGKLRGSRPIDTPEGFKRAIQGISTEISLLHQLLNTVRKASRESQNLKAATSFQIKDKDGNDMSKNFKELFADDLLRRKFPNADEKIRDRLASAILLRRKRILYRRSRYMRDPTKISSLTAPKAHTPVPLQPQPLPVILQQDVVQPTSTYVASTKIPVLSVVTSTTKTATVLDPEQVRRVSTPSVISGMKTIALNEREELPFPASPQGYAVERFKRLEERRRASHEEKLNSLPHYLLYKEFRGRPPLNPDAIKQLEDSIKEAKEDLKFSLDQDWETCRAVNTEVMCPYCCCIISSADCRNEKKWRSVKGGPARSYAVRGVSVHCTLITVIESMYYRIWMPMSVYLRIVTTPTNFIIEVQTG